MEWAVDVAARHPALSRAIVSPNDEWLDVLLEDGRTFRFRPGALVDPEAPEAERRTRLERLIEIGARNATVPTIEREAAPRPSASGSPADSASSAPSEAPGSLRRGRPGADASDSALREGTLRDEDGNPLLLPIVRRADYYIASHQHEHNDSIVYLPLTDFLAIGLAEDRTDVIQPVFFSHLEERGIFSRSVDDDLGDLFGRAIENLRRLNQVSGKHGIELAVTTVAGAKVFTFTSPADYQSSWFADLDIIQQVAASLEAEHPGNLPLFVPASRTNLFIVFADDEHLVDFFSLLRGRCKAKDSLYPLPHTVSSDGWREWIPFADHPAASVLSNLRTMHRERIYATQCEQIRTWPGHEGIAKDYVVRTLRGRRHVSIALWTKDDGVGSVPLTDFVSFVREPTEPWEEATLVTVRSRVAREVWSAGMRKMDNVWPPRWQMTGFPDEETLTQLRSVANRPL